MGFSSFFFFLKLILDLIALWSENMLCMLGNFQNLLRLALWLNLRPTLVRFLGGLKNNFFLTL